jgi:carboxyl-terminal processing protease
VCALGGKRSLHVIRFFRQPFAVVALALALFAGGCVTAPPRTDMTMSAEQRLAHNRRVFDRAWELVNDRFFDAKFRGVDWAAMKTRYEPDAGKAADDAALYGVINAMLGELKESHNFALSPQRRWEYESKQRARVGIMLQWVDECWVVTEVMPNSPALDAGVQRGWIVHRRDGEALSARANFSLKEGEKVSYEFLDGNGEARTLTMAARILPTEDRREERDLADGFVYLRFDGFDRASLHWLSEQLKQHRAAPGVILDLRRNSGGMFYSLEFVLGEFFPHAVPLGTFIRRSGSESGKESWQFFSARYPGKVALLTDGATASCAEILADALRYHHRALIVGRPTAGAVLVSRFFSLPDGGMLQLGVEDFRGLDGKRLEGTGVKPDIEVRLKLADLRAGVDADLDVALAKLRESPAAHD